jgi:hypothetical protein
MVQVLHPSQKCIPLIPLFHQLKIVCDVTGAQNGNLEAPVYSNEKQGYTVRERAYK